MIKILWADDQLDVAKSIASYLSVENCTFEFSPTGDDALKRILENSYDLVLVDLAMPPGRWGGLWLLEQINNLNTNIVSIVVSGEGTQSETIKALRLGAKDYVTKDKLLLELPGQIVSALDNAARARSKVLTLTKSGESDRAEFKSTLRMNLRSAKKDPDLELAVLKTVAGFLNAEGGELLIGVADSGEILGLESDAFTNNDKLQLHFWNIFKEAIGTELTEFVQTEIVTIGDKSVFYVFCDKSDRPVFLKWKISGDSKPQELFYVRVGPQTDLFGIRQALLYIDSHFAANR